MDTCNILILAFCYITLFISIFTLAFAYRIYVNTMSEKDKEKRLMRKNKAFELTIVSLLPKVNRDALIDVIKKDVYARDLHTDAELNGMNHKELEDLCIPIIHYYATSINDKDAVNMLHFTADKLKKRNKEIKKYERRKNC